MADSLGGSVARGRPRDTTSVVHDTGGSSLLLVRRVEALKEAFESGRIEGYSPTSYEIHRGAKRETTLLLNRGLRLTKGKSIYFHCVVGDCWLGAPAAGDALIQATKTVVRCPITATSNAINHLKHHHGIGPKKTAVGKAKTKVIVESVERNEPAFTRDPASFIQNVLVLWATQHSISIAAFQSPFFHQALHRIPGCDRNTMEKTRCRKYLLQQYLTVKQRIKSELEVAKGFFGDVPFISMNLDLYQDPRQNLKYMAIRMSWVDGVSCKLVSRLIAARHYNPTYQERYSAMASTLLASWFKSIVNTEYKITDEMILGASGDHGSDVKKVLREHCGLYGFEEWCISHMLNVVFLDAFGLDIDKVRLTVSIWAIALIDCLSPAFQL
jgi:hypothetical protein